MPRPFDPAAAMQRLNSQFAGAVLLRPGISGTGKNTVRNVATGKVLPCCYGPCDKDGDNRHQVRVPHDRPKFPGEKVIFIFCSEKCKAMWLKGTTYDPDA